MTANEIRSMRPEDYDEVISLWKRCEGVGLSEADSKDGIVRFLQRNNDLSMVALVDSEMVGAILSGHDGRRGYIHHLAVSEPYRRLGIGRSLVDSCLHRLKAEGIQKCHLFVFADNIEARAFWNDVGWSERGELVMVSKYL